MTEYIKDESGNIRAFLQEAAQYESQAAQKKLDRELELSRPFMMLRPRMMPDGDKWCALYGDNIQDGVCAFGDTPAKAAEAFDSAWNCSV
jgi:hypothetical protein